MCLARWEVTGAYACTEHHCLMRTVCPRCRRAISWNRPAIDVCRCGAYLSGGEQDGLDVVDASWMDTLLCKAMPAYRAALSDAARPAWLEPLTADGLFTVVWAFGIRERPSAPIVKESRKTVLAPSRVAQVIQRGLARISGVDVLSAPCGLETRCLLYEEALCRLELRGTTQADRDVASDLLRWARASERRSLRALVRPPRGQLDLFR